MTVLITLSGHRRHILSTASSDTKLNGNRTVSNQTTALQPRPLPLYSCLHSMQGGIAIYRRRLAFRGKNNNDKPQMVTLTLFEALEQLTGSTYSLVVSLTPHGQYHGTHYHIETQEHWEQLALAVGLVLAQEINHAAGLMFMLSGPVSKQPINITEED